jgi:hypothetical protein
LDLTPTRSAQAFPLAFERSARRGVYSPGEIQPSNRGGLVWLGTDRNQLLPTNYYRPGAPRETSGSLIFRSSSFLSLAKKGRRYFIYYINKKEPFRFLFKNEKENKS